MLETARTVKTRPGDNLFVYRALQAIRPGEVLVVDAGGGIDNAIVGEIIELYAASHGCTGFVVDGAIRDAGAFAVADFPCYARGISHRGPYKTGPGVLDIPVSIGGQVVLPGDVVFGDLDGVVSFAFAESDRIIAAADVRQRAEDDIRGKISAGDEGWVSGLLGGPVARPRVTRQ
jgi:regulator of RNase E activity RraA